MKGTPYIYQGEEIGMTNYPFTSLDECQDVEVFNNYKELVEEKQVLTHEEMMKGICYSSRDNGRTPMQWNNHIHAGFTNGIPWIKVNPNYIDINVEQQRQDSNSIYHYYRKLIQLRHDNEMIVYGDYELLEEKHPQLFVYRRYQDSQELLIISNFTNQCITYTLPLQYQDRNKEVLITNQEDIVINHTIALKPYGTLVLKVL